MYQTWNASGFDLVSQEDLIIEPGKVAMIKTGMFLKYDSTYHGDENYNGLAGGIDIQIRPRSGLNFKGIFGLFGTVDADFEGEMKAGLFNSTDEPFEVLIGMRVGQVVVSVCQRLSGVSVKPVVRGEGGFGSTGQ